jgi:hypothetical protein
MLIECLAGLWLGVEPPRAAPERLDEHQHGDIDDALLADRFRGPAVQVGWDYGGAAGLSSFRKAVVRATHLWLPYAR